MPPETPALHLACVGLQAGYAANRPISKHINFEVRSGELMAIMGPSGSGKSTLLKALLGRLRHVAGRIFLNGEDISSTGLACVRSRVAMVPQDDVLVDELTVKENIRAYHTIAVDSRVDPKQVESGIERCLRSLEIDHVANSRVGGTDGSSAGISGGQRKRANLAMELVNDPRILIIDEPTSGLSSRDALSLVKNLKRIALQEQMIVLIIIHQPSPDVFQLFDRLMLLDRQGNCVTSGRVEDVVHRVMSLGRPNEVGCETCGRQSPDKILDIIESRREGWEHAALAFGNTFVRDPASSKMEKVERDSLLRNPAEWWRDFKALIGRQLLIKKRDRMSKLLTWFAPPALGALIGVVFKASPSGAAYAFETNTLYPQLLFMLIICGFFLGLVSSVFEVIKDRAILQREELRGLSPSTYYLSELTTLAMQGALQAALLVAGALLMARGWHIADSIWLAVVIMLLLGSVTGLLVSSLFTSPIAAYNVIPALLIPQIILGGALLPYKDMGDEVFLWDSPQTQEQPALAKAMPASWAYEFVVRRIFAETERRKLVHNTALHAISDLPPKAFLSLSPRRAVRTGTIQRILGIGSSPKAHHQDLLGLALFLGSGAASGFLWINRGFGKPRSANAPAALQLLLILAAIGVYFQATEKTASVQPSPTAESLSQPGQRLRVSERSYSFSGAMAHCAKAGQRVATVDQLVGAYNGLDPTVRKALFWTADREAPSKKVWVLDFSKISAEMRGPLSQESLQASSNKVLFLARENQFWANVACTAS
jgi:ABC-type multidrug transport system ATPase subunit